VLEAIAHLLMMGSTIENLIFALGPAISGKVYQVSEKVAAEVGRCLISLDDPADPVTMLQILKEIPDSPILEDSLPGKVKLDVRRIISLQLQNVGVNIDKIAIAPYCTYQESDLFFSYRRTQEKNIQWSGIISK
jgi:copper oxidase (laccase) domain-containing protein